MNSIRLKIAFLYLAITLHALGCFQQSEKDEVLKGKVIKVYDGDTLTISVADKKHRIRLEGIDAPELDQKYGKNSRDFLKQKLLGQNVEIRVKNIDIYQRKVGQIYYKSESVNLTMIKEGCAWHYKEFSDNNIYANAQSTA